MILAMRSIGGKNEATEAKLIKFGEKIQKRFN